MVGVAPTISIVPTVVVPVVPSMFWAIVGVFTSVIYVIPSEYPPWMLGDLLFNGWMLFQELFYFLMFVEVFAVVYQLGIVL